MKSSLIILLIFSLFSSANGTNKLKTSMTIYDQYYAKRDKIENVHKAVEGHQKLLKNHPHNIDLLWRLSMEYYFLGHKSTEEKKKLSYHQQGIEYGKQCAKYAQGKRVECPFWKATNLALFLQEKGIFSIAFKISEILHIYKEAEKLDATYLGAGPLRMQSIFYYKAPGILGGDSKKATSLIEKAISLAPTEPLNYHFYLQYLLDQGKIEKAKEIATQAIEQITPSKIPFYESRGAFQDIVEFVETGKFTP